MRRVCPARAGGGPAARPVAPPAARKGPSASTRHGPPTSSGFSVCDAACLRPWGLTGGSARSQPVPPPLLEDVLHPQLATLKRLSFAQGLLLLLVHVELAPRAGVSVRPCSGRAPIAPRIACALVELVRRLLELLRVRQPLRLEARNCRPLELFCEAPGGFAVIFHHRARVARRQPVASCCEGAAELGVSYRPNGLTLFRVFLLETAPHDQRLQFRVIRELAESPGRGC